MYLFPFLHFLPFSSLIFFFTFFLTLNCCTSTSWFSWPRRSERTLSTWFAILAHIFFPAKGENKYAWKKYTKKPTDQRKCLNYFLKSVLNTMNLHRAILFLPNAAHNWVEISGVIPVLYNRNLGQDATQRDLTKLNKGMFFLMPSSLPCLTFLFKTKLTLRFFWVF